MANYFALLLFPPFAQSFRHISPNHSGIVHQPMLFAGVRSSLVHRSFIAHKFGRNKGIVMAQFGCGFGVFMAKIRAWKRLQT